VSDGAGPLGRLLGPIRQNGYVVRDLRAALDHWIHRLGVGPWYLIEEVKLDWFRHRGEDSSPRISIALANSGPLQIELIQQHDDAPSLYREFLDAGREGLQHLAFWSTDYQPLYDAMLARGYTIGHEGQIGGEQGRFAYFDCDAHPGAMIEISDVGGAKGRFFEAIRRAAEDWDGSDPIRPV
jgi:hypothetical protein